MGALGVRYSYIIGSALENEFIHIETIPFLEWHLHRCFPADIIAVPTTTQNGTTRICLFCFMLVQGRDAHLHRTYIYLRSRFTSTICPKNQHNPTNAVVLDKSEKRLILSILYFNLTQKRHVNPDLIEVKRPGRPAHVDASPDLCFVSPAPKNITL
eukprot:4096639-Amphidinium_carterae.1